MDKKPFDPLERAMDVEDIVCSEERRKYYRFRAANYYGGIATADGVGCCLNCVFCWSWNTVTEPERWGLLYSPEEVAERLITISRKRNFRRLRISGDEPTIGRAHLMELLKKTPTDIQFILETNGILIGNDPQFAKDLAAFPQAYVRVSIKGASPEEFSHLTGAVPEAFELQLTSLVYLKAYGVKCHPACMTYFSNPANIQKLRKQLRRIDSSFGDFEEEGLILYPAIEQRLRQQGWLRNIRS